MARPLPDVLRIAWPAGSPEPPAATLAALPVMGMTHEATTTVRTPAEPQWGWVFGMEGTDALILGAMETIECSFFVGPASIACGATGLL